MLWTPGSPIQPNSSHLVPEPDLETFILELSYTSTDPASLGVTALSVEAVNALPLTRVLLSASEFDTLIETEEIDPSALKALIGRFDPGLHEALESIVVFLHALWLAEPLALRNALLPMTQSIAAAKAIPSTSRVWSGRLAKYLVHLVNDLHRAWRDPSIYAYGKLDPAIKSWWDNAPTLLVTCANSLQKYERLVTRAAPTPVAEVQQWITRIAAALASLQRKRGSPDYHESFLCASASFFTTAEVCHRRRDVTMTLLHLHRALEWLFVSKLAEDDELVYTYGLQFRNPAKLSERDVTFHRAMTWCRAQGYIDGAQKSTAESVNDWRNESALTHSMLAPTQAVLDGLASEVETLLRNVGASAWLQHYNSMSEALPVDLALLLDANRFLRNGIRRVSPSELVIA